jgi:Protein of unknown function (DUF2808)
MQHFTKISILALATATSILLVDFSAILTSIPSVQAVRLRDGKTYFTQPPTLVDAETTINSIYAWGATYYFRLKLPENAGEPMQRVTIHQYEGGDKVGFDLKESFVSTISSSGEQKRLDAEITVSDRDPRMITISFTSPIPPGNVLSIGLRPYSNPRNSGIYLFGVTAFAVGESAHGQFLGYGRLQFYDRGARSNIFGR